MTPSDGIEGVIIASTASIREAMARLDAAGTGALVVCAGERRVCGLLTDGDIRRALLRKVSLEEPCLTIASRNPVSVRPALFAGDALHLMNQHDIDHLPVIDEAGDLQDLLLRSDLVGAERSRTGAKARLDLVIAPNTVSIAEALSRLEKAGTGALALCAGARKLVGVVTDGDVRRAMLRRVPLEDRCETIATRSPVTAPASASAADALRLMDQHGVDQIPLVDADGTLTEFVLRRDLVDEDQLRLSAVIMAGGLGTRLRPLTEQVPKPMLPVGDRPLLERTIRQLRRAGIRDVSLVTHYLPDKIAEHFGDGGAFGVRLSYRQEERPMGTAGGLRLLERPRGPFVVLNGDVLTGVSFHDMLQYHKSHGAEITVGVRKYEVAVPFGVVECDDVRITRLTEKPSLTFFISAGIYLLEPTACDHIPEGQRFDMTDLIPAVVAAGRTVAAFPIREYWLDVGRLEDYQKAQDDVLGGRI
ncbi:MAG TPA: nucleotidyltransferase family protein [Gemmatimonadales bacterium]|nr:nucleotidyltransferase family protein [Gemmatimonadales bacterium]